MSAEGTAEVREDQVFVDTESLYSIDEVDRLSLSVAPPFPFIPVLSCSSDMAHDDFRYELKYEKIDRSPAPILSRCGCCFESGGERWLIPQSLWQLLKELQSASSDCCEEDRLVRFYSIRGSLEASGGRIADTYLSELDVIVPESLEIELCPGAGDSINVLPRIEHSANRIFQRAFRQRTRNVYALRPGAGTRRLVFKTEHRENLKEIKQLQGIRGEQKARFLEKPELFLSTDSVDLTDFPRQAARFGGIRRRANIRRESGKAILHVQSVIAEPEQPAPLPVELSREKAARLLDEVKSAREAGRSQVCLDGLPPVLAQKSLEVHLESVIRPTAPLLEERHEKLEVPGTLTRGLSLLPHQLEGLEWLQDLFREGADGALLADDMGLGKTLQLLTFFEWLRHRMDTMGPSLLIAPVGLLYNWQQEYQKFFQGENALTDNDILPLFGENLKLFQRSDRTLDLGAVSRHPLVLTSYETLRSRRTCFEQLAWTLVILDEAQKVKNPRAQVTETVKSLDTIFRVACTGTPVENSLSDLWCLMDFASPGLLGERKEFLKSHEPQTEAEFESLGERIEERLGDRFLRRRKVDILKDLPPKIESSPKVPMKGLQRDQYQGATANYDRSNALELISRLRRLSCSADCEPPKGQDYSSFSAKLQWMIRLLRDIETAGEKALIFVEYKDVQRILAEALGREFGLTVDMINGDVPTSASGKALSRTQIIDRFEQKQGFNVIILSPLAAGFGLTITAANHVVHFLRHWNPAKEDQATDRAYRIGQTKPVHVYYPAATLPGAKSFDERLGELLDEKRRLASSAVFPSLFGKVVAEEMLDILDSSLAGNDARVRAVDLDELNRGAKLGVLAALLKKSDYEVYAVDSPGLDLLALHSDQGSYLFSLDLPESQRSELQTGCLHYQQYAPSKLSGCAVSTNSENRTLRGPDWSRAEFEKRLAETPIYWKDVYQRVPFFSERAESRTASQIEKNALTSWSRVFGDRVPRDGVISQASELSASFGLEIARAQLCFTPSHELAIRIPAVPNLPRFVKTLSLRYDGRSKELKAQPARYAPTFLPVEPYEGQYNWTVPGYEEEMDRDLEPLQLSLSGRLPTLFLRQADNYWYRQKSKKVCPGRQYGILIPPDFAGMPPPEKVTRISLNDWRFDRFQAEDELSQEIRVYLAQLGLSAGERQSRLEYLGPGIRDADRIVAFSSAGLFSLEANGPTTASLSDGSQVQSLEVADAQRCYLMVEAESSGGYVFKASPHSTRQSVLSNYLWLTDQEPSPPSANHQVLLHDQEIANEQPIDKDSLSALTLLAPPYWPVAVIAVMDHEDRKWTGDLEEPTTLGTILEEIALYPPQYEQLISVSVHFEALGSIHIPLRRAAGLESIQARFQKIHRELQRQRGLGTLSIAALSEIYATPVTRTLGYFWKPQTHGNCIYGAFQNSPRKGFMMVLENQDLGDDALRSQASEVAARLDLSEIFLTNATHWVLVRAQQSKFAKRPMNLRAALNDPEAFEDFLATFASEDL